MTEPATPRPRPADPAATPRDPPATPRDPASASPRPAFGPRGYLPERAARRARKIVLREQMGIGWPLAAVGTAAVLLVVALFSLDVAGPPAEPFAQAGPLDTVAPGPVSTVEVGDAGSALVVRASGRVRAYVPPGGDVAWCEEARRLESGDGRVWTLDGILVGGRGESLRSLPSSVYAGELYVDLTTPGRELPTDPRGETPACS